MSNEQSKQQYMTSVVRAIVSVMQFANHVSENVVNEQPFGPPYDEHHGITTGTQIEASGQRSLTHCVESWNLHIIYGEEIGL